MASEEETLKAIVQEFPHLKYKISELFDVSSTFIELCEDYVLCLTTIKKAESMKEKVTEEDLTELRTVLLELKEELLSRI
jgi:uncharacterized protein YdcH (DUF465 family)